VVSIFGSHGKVYELETDNEGLFILTVPWTGSSVVNILGYKNELFLSFKFKFCKSVHHRTIQIKRQPDATIFQFIILTFKHQDNKLENCCIWLAIYLNYFCLVGFLDFI
jgi:hypothetical protein